MVRVLTMTLLALALVGPNAVIMEYPDQGDREPQAPVKIGIQLPPYTTDGR